MNGRPRSVPHDLDRTQNRPRPRPTRSRYLPCQHTQEHPRRQGPLRRFACRPLRGPCLSGKYRERGSCNQPRWTLLPGWESGTGIMRLSDITLLLAFASWLVKLDEHTILRHERNALRVRRLLDHRDDGLARLNLAHRLNGRRSHLENQSRRQFQTGASQASSRRRTTCRTRHQSRALEQP